LRYRRREQKAAFSTQPRLVSKGRSGNPKGRPRSSRGSAASAFEVLVDKTLTVSDRGGTREITVEDALEELGYTTSVS
jgi:hypothetical protein